MMHPFRNQSISLLFGLSLFTASLSIYAVEPDEIVCEGIPEDGIGVFNNEQTHSIFKGFTSERLNKDENLFQIPSFAIYYSSEDFEDRREMVSLSYNEDIVSRTSVEWKSVNYNELPQNVRETIPERIICSVQ